MWSIAGGPPRYPAARIYDGRQRYEQLVPNRYEATLSDLPHDSVANVTQPVTLDRQAMTERVGHLPDWLVEQVGDGLRRALAL